jgi:hypothetical protein
MIFYRCAQKILTPAVIYAGNFALFAAQNYAQTLFGPYFTLR